MIASFATRITPAAAANRDARPIAERGDNFGLLAEVTEEALDRLIREGRLVQR